MMYDRSKGVHGRYGNAPILCSGFRYCTLRVSLKVLEICFHLQKIFAVEALVDESCCPCPNKQVTIILITVFATSHMCSPLSHIWKSPIIHKYFSLPRHVVDGAVSKRSSLWLNAGLNRSLIVPWLVTDLPMVLARRYSAKKKTSNPTKDRSKTNYQ